MNEDLFDLYIEREIKNECILILDLFGQKFLGNELQDNKSENENSNNTTLRSLPKGAFSISKSSNQDDRFIIGGKRRYDYQFRNF